MTIVEKSQELLNFSLHSISEDEERKGRTTVGRCLQEKGIGRRVSSHRNAHQRDELDPDARDGVALCGAFPRL